MAGSVEGGKKAAVTNKAKYGDTFYKSIGAKGGRVGTTGGFGQGEKGKELARRAGVLGGRKSRRGSRAESR